MNRGWLIVFAKAPRPGLVKTRLAPPLDLEQAAKLYSAMLDDVLAMSADAAETLGLEAVLAVHPPDAIQEFTMRAPPVFRVVAQRGEGLAERMANAFAEAAAAGAPWALLRGSDSPSLSIRHLESAIRLLETETDAVFSPDQGGGYAMVGQKTPERRLFDVPMSTGEMLMRTEHLGESLGLRLARTEPAMDLDEADDLKRLLDLAQSDPDLATKICPRTIQELGLLQRERVL